MFSTIRFRPRKACRRPRRTTPSSVVLRASREVTSRAAKDLKDKAVRGLKVLARDKVVRDLKARDLARAVKDRTSPHRSPRIRD